MMIIRVCFHEKATDNDCLRNSEVVSPPQGSSLHYQESTFEDNYLEGGSDQMKDTCLE